MTTRELSARAGLLLEILEDLTGQKPPLISTAPEDALTLLDQEGRGLGYSQLNELLLLLGYDRITLDFFQYLADDSLEYRTGSAFHSLEQLQSGTEKPRDVDELTSRHDPVQPLLSIPGGDTFYLGYVVQRDLQSRLAKDSNDPVALAGRQKREEIVSAGIRNHVAYLASDHLDVYIATSMREPHEYLLVNRLTGAIFGHERLRELKLRWFDPTQAYCHDRIDKGLSEALMLRRAKCTVYFVQETDTLGKDSELASTLAQGKPVIAFVPQGDEAYATDLLRRLQETYPAKSERELILEQLRVFEPGAAWSDATVREWLTAPGQFDIQRAKDRLTQAIRSHYDRRARMLLEDHPLGIQVNLETGVANGVLVARSVEECSELIRRVLTRTLDFKLEVKWLNNLSTSSCGRPCPDRSSGSCLETRCSPTPSGTSTWETDLGLRRYILRL